MPKTYRTSVKLTPEAKEAVEELAKKRRASVSSTLEALVGTGLVVEGIGEAGWHVSGHQPDKPPPGPHVLISGDGFKLKGLPAKIETMIERLSNKR